MLSGKARSGILVVYASCASLAACSREVAVPMKEAEAASIVVVAGPPAERVQAGEAKRGVGWYPDVEVDSDGRVHVAWTDADVGDVLYAVSPAGATTLGEPEPVETTGAAGAFVRLALAPGGVPVVSTFNQSDHTLRVAHRPADEAAMKAAGAAIDDEPAAPAAARALAKGWVGEDIAFGDDAGAGSALAVDADGRVHLAYGVGGMRMRYARRPANASAFGAKGTGHWEKIDIDPKTGQSPAVKNDIELFDDGTVVVSYCDWQVAMAHLRLAVRAPGAVSFTVQSAREQPKPGIDGPSNALLRRADGKLDVAAVRLDDASLLVGTFDPKAPAPLVDRVAVTPARGPAVVQRSSDGTLWILVRDPVERRERVPGLYLVEVPPVQPGEASKATRVLLEKGTTDDPWIDLALRSDGKPIAVWFSEEAKGLKLYAP